MSTIKADNIATLAGVSTSMANAVNGSAKAWVNFNGNNTVAISASFNVSSITDNGTGDYTVNFSTAMPDANYAYAFGRVCPDTSGNNLAMGLAGSNSGASAGAKTASVFRLRNGIAYPNSYHDSADMSVLFFR